jgi:hypothetical protein
MMTRSALNYTSQGRIQDFKLGGGGGGGGGAPIKQLRRAEGGANMDPPLLTTVTGHMALSLI